MSDEPLLRDRFKGLPKPTPEVAKVRADYERIVGELGRLAGDVGMVAAVMMVEVSEDGAPAVDNRGIENIAEFMAKVGYDIIPTDELQRLRDEVLALRAERDEAKKSLGLADRAMAMAKGWRDVVGRGKKS